MPPAIRVALFIAFLSAAGCGSGENPLLKTPEGQMIDKYLTTGVLRRDPYYQVVRYWPPQDVSDLYLELAAQTDTRIEATRARVERAEERLAQLREQAREARGTSFERENLERVTKAEEEIRGGKGIVAHLERTADQQRVMKGARASRLTFRYYDTAKKLMITDVMLLFHDGQIGVVREDDEDHLRTRFPD
jgi:hypothetical protein